MVSGIIGNHQAPGKLPGIQSLQILRKPFRGPGHRIAVHAVRAGAHDSPKTSRPKFQIPVKPVFYFFFIMKGRKLLLRFIIGPGEPVFIRFFISHMF